MEYIRIHQRYRGALVDRGANGNIVGNDARVIRKLERMVDVTGIDNHELNLLKWWMLQQKNTVREGCNKKVGLKKKMLFLLKQTKQPTHSSILGVSAMMLIFETVQRWLNT